MTKAQELFKGLNLPQDAAQSLIDFHANSLKAQSAAADKVLTEMQAEWKAKSQADPEIGPKTQQIKENISRAFDVIGQPKLVEEFKSLMDMTGLGDHPAFIKVVNELAKRITESKPVHGAGPSPHGQAAPGTSVRPSPAQALYPNLPS